MIKTIKNFKWFFTISFICLLLGVFTFITFINQNFIFLNENNLQYLLILDVVLLIIFLIFLIKETSQLYSELKFKKTGSRTSLNYVLQFSLFAFIPSLIVAVFSLVLFNVALQKYFDKKITSAVNNSYEVAKNYIEESKRSVEADIFLISLDLNKYYNIYFSNPTKFKNFVKTQRLLRKIDEIYLIDSAGTILLRDTNDSENEFIVPSEEYFSQALEGKPVSIDRSAENKTAFMIKLSNYIDTYLYIAKNVQPQLLNYLDATEQAVNFYYTVENNRTGIKITFAFIYVIVISMLLFMTIMLAITFASRLTKPIINLISASNKISSGKLDSKVPDIDSDDEIKTLNKNFNNMIERLKVQQDKLLLAERFSAWETVARKLAHEIKNPLTPIQLSIDRLKEKYSKKFNDNDEFKKYLETINRQIIEIKKLADEFSDFARMPSPILKKINVYDVINESIEFYKMSHKDLKISLKAKTNFKYIILGDADQLNRVFLNLIKNSIEAIDDKKQKDTGFHGKIDVEIDENNEYIEIKMLDNGTGFKSIKEGLKPYYTTKKDGTGLGLPIVSKIINEHKGDIQIKNDSNGANVNIFLPKIS